MEVGLARDRRGLGHPPAVDHREPVALLEAGDHRARRRRAADEHPLQRGEVPAVGLGVEQREDPEPDRRHARGRRHLLLLEVVEQALGVEVRPRVDLLRAEHRRDVRVAPRVRVEHRHDGQDHVALREVEAERRGDGDPEGVQHRRAVRVDDALRPPGGAARVAHRRGLVLVQAGVAPRVRVGAREQLLVRVLDDEHVLDRGAVAELLEHRHERAVDDHRAVARVGRDVGQVVRMEAEVQRVEDEAAGRDAEVRLDVLVVVPAERRDAVAALEAERLEPHGERAGAPGHLGVGVAVEALVGQARDDLGAPEVRLGAPQQRRERELEVHHHAVHRGPSWAADPAL